MRLYTDEEIAKRVKRKKIRKIILRIILYPIIATIFIISTALVVQKLKAPTQIPNIFRI